MSELNEVMDWDAVIVDDGNEYAPKIILEEGDYKFTVSKLDRTMSKGSEKLPPSRMAKLTLSVESDQGTATIITNLILHKSLEWKLSQFFRSIGQKRHGEKMKMNWGKVVGSYGIAHITKRTYTGQDGTEHETNDVSYFLDYDPKAHSEDTFNTIPENAPNEIPFI